MKDILEIINDYINRFAEKVSEAERASTEEENLEQIDEVLNGYEVCTIFPSAIHVAVLEVERCYGGPEEGGWWYDASAPVEHIMLDVIWERPASCEPASWDIDIRQLEMVHKIVEIWKDRYEVGRETRGNVRGGPDYYIDVDFKEQEVEPKERPRYE